jgi:hypothetical protein
MWRVVNRSCFIILSSCLSSVELSIILETETRCQLNASSSSGEFVTVRENEVIEVQCQVNYRGAWTPVIYCEQGTNVTSVSNSTSLQYTALISASVAMSSSRIKCWTFFDSSISRPSDATNVAPALRLKWNSQILQVTSKYRLSNATF